MNYSLSTIRRGLSNLFAKRLEALEASKAGVYFKHELHSLHDAIGDLPASVSAIPFKDELRTTDDRHDKLGKVIHLVTDTALVHPQVAPNVVEAAQKIRDAFVPALEELNAPYATEGERAGDRRALLTTLEPELKLFVLPWDKNQTLLDVAKAFLDEGDKLEELLHQRANEPKGLRTQAGVLRAKAVGVLNRLRKDLAKELEQNGGLPRDLSHKVFGLFDTLHAMEASGRGHETVEGEDDATQTPLAEAKPG